MVFPMNTTTANLLSTITFKTGSKRQVNAAKRELCKVWLNAVKSNDTATLARIENVFNAYNCSEFLPSVI